jgi:hypothetical protein
VSLTPEALSAVRGATKRLALQQLLVDTRDSASRAARAYERSRVELVRASTSETVALVAGAADLKVGRTATLEAADRRCLVGPQTQGWQGFEQAGP